jgi:hypothetical protein
MLNCVSTISSLRGAYVMLDVLAHSKNCNNRFNTEDITKTSSTF